jgi:hypothetical protein
LFWLRRASLSLIVGRIFTDISNKTLGTAVGTQLLQNQNYDRTKFSSLLLNFRRRGIDPLLHSPALTLSILPEIYQMLYKG